MPYTGWAGFAYDAALPRAALREVLGEAARREIRVASMGTDLLDLYEDVNRVVPIRDRRWVVEHISTLTADEIARIRDLGVVVTTHTNRYLFKEGEILPPRLSAEDSIVPLRNLRDADLTLSPDLARRCQARPVVATHHRARAAARACGSPAGGDARGSLSHVRGG